MRISRTTVTLLSLFVVIVLDAPAWAATHPPVPGAAVVSAPIASDVSASSCTTGFPTGSTVGSSPNHRGLDRVAEGVTWAFRDQIRILEVGEQTPTTSTGLGPNDGPQAAASTGRLLGQSTSSSPTASIEAEIGLLLGVALALLGSGSALMVRRRPPAP